MARRLFGDRKGARPLLPDTADWPQLPGVPRPAPEPNGLIPILASALSAGSGASGTSERADAAEEELLDRIGAFRAAVSDSLYEMSKDYQILRNLAHADLKACDDIVEELRGRLADNLHYRVLAKLDEVHALVAEHLGRKE